jgi:hypothetical protein
MQSKDVDCLLFGAERALKRLHLQVTQYSKMWYASLSVDLKALDRTLDVASSMKHVCCSSMACGQRFCCPMLHRLCSAPLYGAPHADRCLPQHRDGRVQAGGHSVSTQDQAGRHQGAQVCCESNRKTHKQGAHQGCAV